MDKRDYTFGTQNANGEFDVFAKIRGNTTGTEGSMIVLFPATTKEDIEATLRDMLQNGTLARDSDGKYYLPEQEQKR